MTKAHIPNGDVPSADPASPAPSRSGGRFAAGSPIATVDPEPRSPGLPLPDGRGLIDPPVRDATRQAGKVTVDLKTPQTGRLGGDGAPRPGPRLIPRGRKGRSADRMLHHVDGEEEISTGFRQSQELQARAVLIAMSRSKVRP